MGKIYLLDCTLREAPIDNLEWGKMNICKLIRGLEEAKVDIIECGFLKNNNYMEGSTSFQKTEDILPFIAEKKEEITYTALVDYGRYDLKYLSDYDGKSIDTIRVCFKKNEIDKVLDYAAEIREKGYKVCIQHVDTMNYSDEEIIKFIDAVNKFKPYAYSVVDTFGAMYQEDMIRFTSTVNQYLDSEILLGFHAHNNLLLADANEQEFINTIGHKRDIIVDTSLFGCGRSAGNAHTELLARFINKKFGNRYDIDILLDLIDTVISTAQKITSWGYSIPYFIAGMYNAHTFNVKHLLKRHNIQSKDLRAIIERLDEYQKKKYDYALLEKLYVEYFDIPVEDSEVLEKVKINLKNKTILLLAPGKSIVEERTKIENFIALHSPTIIAVNNIISNYPLDFIFYSSKNRYKQKQFQEYASNIKFIITSNIKAIGEKNEYIVNYSSLLKYGWVNLDSAIILLLRLLIKCNVKKVYIAGLDGYGSPGDTFYCNDLETGMENKDRVELTRENSEMICDMLENHPDFKIEFITKSVYEKVL